MKINCYAFLFCFALVTPACSTPCINFSVQSLLPKDNLFKNVFDFTTAGDWDCVAAVHCPSL